MSGRLRLWILPIAFTIAGASEDSMLAPQAPPQPAASREDPVARAIAQWERQTGITVSSTAKQNVSAAFRAVSVQEEIGRLQQPRQAQVLSAGVTEYLGDIRDSSRASTIDAKAMKAIPPDKAAEAFAKKLANGPVGRLVVTSKPTNAGITIDRQAKGFTDKTFVVSAGIHSVLVKMQSPSLSCSRDVDVPEGGMVVFPCPAAN